MANTHVRENHRYKGGLCISAAGLSVACLAVLIQGADGEPFTTFRSVDAYVQIGVAMTLMILWALFAAVLIYGFVRRLISVRWSPFLIWVGVCEVFLYGCATGYVQDITKYVVGTH